MQMRASPTGLVLPVLCAEVSGWWCWPLVPGRCSTSGARESQLVDRALSVRNQLRSLGGRIYDEANHNRSVEASSSAGGELINHAAKRDLVKSRMLFYFDSSKP